MFLIDTGNDVVACSLFGGPLDRMRYGLYREVCSSLAAERKSLAFHVSDARLRTLICVQSQKSSMELLHLISHLKPGTRLVLQT